MPVIVLILAIIGWKLFDKKSEKIHLKTNKNDKPVGFYEANFKIDHNQKSGK